MFALLLLLCTACTRSTAAGSAQIVTARIAAEPGAVLVSDLRLRFSPTMLEALDHGIALRLEFRLRSVGTNDRLETRRGLWLRYLPLAQQYQLSDDGGTLSRSFVRRSQLLAALDRVRLPLDPGWAALGENSRMTLSMSLDHSALPGPLRLPALIEPAWQLVATEYAWTSGA